MKIGFTTSTFDLLHTGHILMLQEAKEQCDYLICGLHVDPSIEREEKNKPIQSLYGRFIQLKAVKYVDEIIPYSTEDELLVILQTNNINIRIIGEDYWGRNYTGKFLIDNEQMEVYYNKRRHDYSSSELRSRIAKK